MPEQSFLRWLLLCPTGQCQTFVTHFDDTHVWQGCQLCGKVRSRRPREDVVGRRAQMESQVNRVNWALTSTREFPLTQAEAERVRGQVAEYLQGLSERGAIYDTEQVQFDEPCSRAPGPADWPQEYPTVRHVALVSRLNPDYATDIERAFAGLSTPAPEEPYFYDPDDFSEGTDPCGDDRHADGPLV